MKNDTPEEITVEVRNLKRHTLYQLAVEVVLSNPDAIQNVFWSVINTVYDWLEERLHLKIEEAIRKCPDFSMGLERPDLTCEAVFEEYMWSVCLMQTEPPFEQDHAVPGRTWVSEITLQKHDANLKLGIRIVSTSAGDGVNERVTCHKPSLVDRLAEQCPLRDVRRLNGRSWILEKKNDLKRFYHLLTSPRRTLPIVLLTQFNPYSYRFRFTVDDLALARSACGVAHVVCLPRELESDWTQIVGGSWTATGGAVRVYWPNIDWDHDSPVHHPIAVPNWPGPWPVVDRLDWKYTDGANDPHFRAFLVESLLIQNALRPRDWSDFKFYREIRTRRFELDRESKAETERKRAEELEKIESKDELCQELLSEVSRLKGVIEDLKKTHMKDLGLLDHWLQDNKLELEVSRFQTQTYQRQLEETKADNRCLRALNDSLRISLRSKTGDFKEEIEFPNDYEEMDSWVKAHYSGRLMLHPRSVHNLRKAVYEDVELVYKALTLLATSFRDMKTGTITPEQWETERAQLGLHFSGSISESELGKHKSDYLVPYPLHSQHTRFAEFHLRKGATREDRYCLAIYFFWDEENKLVVVAWLPSHLDNRFS